MIVLCDRVASERSGKLQRNEMEGNVARAAYYYEWEEVRRLVEQGGNVNDVYGTLYRRTALHFAALHGNPDICSLLLSRGANVSQTDKNGDTPLHFAAYYHRVGICQLFVDHKADVTSVNNKGKTPLHRAVSCYWGGSGNVCPLLITNETVNVADPHGNRALHIAARNDNIYTVQLLVDCGADVNVLNGDGQTPLHTAAGREKDCPEFCSILLKHNAKIDAVDKDGNQPLHLACETAVTSTVQHLLDCNADVLATNNFHQTALHKAACSKRDCPEVCLMLIAKGAQVNATDGSGDTSLHVAFQKGKMNTVDVLVENDGDCNVVNVCGETLLHLACKSRVECVELCDKLISHGVNPHIADREGNLPLRVAFKNRLAKTFSRLFEQLGYSTLNDLEKVNIGKELVANLDSANEAGDTRSCHYILELIAKLDTSNRFILSALDCRSRSGYLLLHTAIQKQDFTLSQYLIDHGASVNAEVVPYKNHGRRCNEHPLHLAVKLGCIDLCRLLIEHGARVDAEMKGGRTALHLAIVNEKKDVTRLLLSHGADLSKVEISGESAVKRSEKRGNLKMASIIQASGEREKRNILHTLLTLLKFVLFIETFPEEIVSQGETALRIYLSSCDEGSAVDVFLRVDVVGRDGAGKTSLTKSLTLQKFNRDEPSTRGVVFDPKCQIIVKEACDWTKPLTSADYTEIYEKNVVINMADTLDTPQVKDQYFKSKEGQRPKRQKLSRVASKSSKQDLNIQAVSVPFTDDIEVAKSQESQVDFVQQSPIPSPIMNAIESLTQDLDLQSFPVMSVDDIESLLYHAVDSFQMSPIHSPVMNPMLSVATATSERSDDVSSLLSETQQTISAVSEPPQSAASDMQQSLQTPLNLSTCKDSNVFPPNTATEWQSPSGTNIQVVSACSTSHEQLEKDSMDVDKSVEDERDSNSIVTNFGSRLPSSQQEQEQQPKKQRLKKRKRKAIEFEGIKMSDGSKCQNFSQPEIKKKTMQSVIRNTDVLSSDNQDMQQQQQQQQQQEGTKVNRKKQTKASSSQSEETLPLNVDESSTENTTTLPRHIQERVSKSLRDPSSRQKAKKEIMLTVLDYAGQNVFYVTHHLIMSKAGFMYIVFNASLPMDGKTPCQFRSEDGQIIHIPLFNNETNFDRLEEWVSGVHIMEGDQSRRIMIFEKEGIRSPAMFLVGTHADELKEQPGMMEKQDAFIRKKLEGTVLAEHIIWASKDVMCFYVDNTVTDPDSGFVDPQVKLLRQKTEEVAHKVAQHHRLPIKWLKYEQKVREVKVSYPTKKTTTVDELLQLAMNAAGIKSREELLVLLQYLSSRAVLMYHPMALKSGGDEEVVLDVEWFVSQLQKVITIYMEGDVPPMLWNDVKRSKEKGIMTMSLVRHLLSDAGSAQRLILSLMRHYDLLCEYSVLEEDNLKTASDCKDFLSLEGGSESHCEVKRDVFESKACFIPCLLEHAVGLESDKMNDELKSLPLILSSAPIRIPQPLFYRVLTLLCKRFRRLAVIYHNVGYFHIYPGHRLEFSLNRYNFQMTVLSETHAPLNAKVCVAIREWIVDVVDKAKQQGMPGLKLQLGFECDVSTSTSNIEFISLDGYQHSRFQLYSSVMKREVQPPLRLSLWYPQHELTVSRFCIVRFLSIWTCAFVRKVKRCYHSMLPLNYHGITVVYSLSCLYY